MPELFSGFVLLLVLATVFWLVLGRPIRGRQRRGDRRHHGGRRPRSRGFWAMPARDRDYTPGLLLLVFATWQLAGVVTGSAAGSPYVVTAIILCAVLALGFVIQPSLVGAGMGAIGVVSQLLSRLGASGCRSYTAAENEVFFLGAGLLLVTLIAARLLLSPVRAAERFVGGGGSFWTSPGRRHAPGRIAALALSTAGGLDVIDLATQPGDTLAQLHLSAGTFGLLVVLVAASAVVAFGLSVLPNFTLSVLGLGVAVATVLVGLVAQPSCQSWTLRIAIAISLLVTNRVAARFI